MKTIRLTFILLTLLLISGQSCVINSDYLQPTSPSEDIITRNEIYTIRFFIKNPTQNTFIGKVEYQFDEKCLSTFPKSEEVTITPQESKKAMAKEFRTNSVNKECSQKPQRVTVVIRDRGGDIKDSFDILLSIA
ncbi:MAG: hypothetical protein CMH62_03840 [Nanoarchaeota archaeon]|nr:hypothetical protein [Nanoarchaeota archaeon]